MSLDVMLEFTAGVLFIFLQINMRGQVIFCWSQVLIGKGWRNGCIVVLVLFRSILNTTLANPTQRFSGPSFFSCFRCHLFPFFFLSICFVLGLFLFFLPFIVLFVVLFWLLSGLGPQVLGCVYEPDGSVGASTYPLAKKAHSLEFLRSIAHLRPRTKVRFFNVHFEVYRYRLLLPWVCFSYFCLILNLLK